MPCTGRWERRDPTLGTIDHRDTHRQQSAPRDLPTTVLLVLHVPAVVEELGDKLKALGWVSDLLVAGSLATGDYVAGVSDLDLVAVVDGQVDSSRMASLAALHAGLDEGPGAGLDLGCVYVSATELLDLLVLHPTWTHGRMVKRTFSDVTRAELVRHGFAVLGRPPLRILKPMTDVEVQEAARAELLGYWAWAARWPWLWLDPEFADLGLTSMARGRHTLRTGELITKTRAVEEAAVPVWLVDQLRARRQGNDVPSPRLRTASLAWCDARRTVALARVHGPMKQS